MKLVSKLKLNKKKQKIFKDTRNLKETGHSRFYQESFSIFELKIGSFNLKYSEVIYSVP
jgi:hypothetical protein